MTTQKDLRENLLGDLTTICELCEAGSLELIENGYNMFGLARYGLDAIEEKKDLEVASDVAVVDKHKEVSAQTCMKVEKLQAELNVRQVFQIVTPSLLRKTQRYRKGHSSKRRSMGLSMVLCCWKRLLSRWKLHMMDDLRRNLPSASGQENETEILSADVFQMRTMKDRLKEKCTVRTRKVAWLERLIVKARRNFVEAQESLKAEKARSHVVEKALETIQHRVS